MKNIILLLCFLVSSMMNGQTMWRPIGPDDYNQASYGITNFSSEGTQNSRLTSKNGNVYLMNLELGATNKSWFVMSKFSNGYWQHIDTPFWLQESQTNFSFEVDNNEVPYLFISDPSNGNKAAVKKYNGTDWVDVGGTAVSTATATPISMAVGDDNLPFIIYQEGMAVKVNKFNGSTWDFISTTDLDGLNYTAVVKTDHNNMPYVLYNGFLKKFNGSGWDEVGITGFSSAGNSICFDTQNTPYVVAGTSIRKFDGVTWQTLPSLPSVNGSVTLAIDADDNLFAAYRNTFLLDKNIVKFVGGVWQSWGSFSSYGPLAISIDGNTVYEQHTKNTNFPVVQKRTGSIWEMLGVESELQSDFNYSVTNDLAIYNGLPVVCYKNYKLAVKESDANGVWGNVGAIAISEETISNTKLDTDSDGNLYVAYINIIASTSTSRITVKKRVGNNWELVGPLNFSLDCTTYMDFKINHQNIPYIVYQSGRVQKFNGTSWEFVGGSAYAYDRDVQMTFDNNDQPYIIYQGDLVPIIKKFNGANWEEVGTQSLSTFTNIIVPRIIVDASNNIVIAFVDSLKKIHVLTWNGTVWVQLGSEIETNTGIGNNYLSLALAIDHNNVLHIMFNRMYNGFRKMVNVNKFNGTDWESLGNPDFSPGDVTEGKITFNNNNLPIVSYSSLNGIYVKYFGDENAFLSTIQQQIAVVNTIVISPNPITSSFSVKSDDKIETIDIFDLTGKKVFSSSETEELNISSLMNGLYLIKVKTNIGIYSEKIFKK